jgi:hypothetical protein
MYAFLPFRREPHEAPGCYVALSCRMPGFSLADPARELRLIQSRLVYEIAKEALSVESGYAIAKKLIGEDFATTAPPRWWEQLANRKLDLPRALLRREPKALAWMESLKQRTDGAEHALSMPLWNLALPHSVRVSSVMTWRASVEAMGYEIPEPPMGSPASSTLYTNALADGLLGENPWAGVNLAVFCLRLAEARGNLAQFVLTYKTLLSSRSFQLLNTVIPVWTSLAFFFESNYSTLQINVANEAEFLAAGEELTDHGLAVRLMSLTRDEDDRYALVDSISKPIFDCSIPSNFIFVDF